MRGPQRARRKRPATCKESEPHVPALRAPRGVPSSRPSPSDADALAFVDEHARVVDAPPERAWEALVRVMPRAVDAAAGARFVRLLGCVSTAPEGAFPEPGSALVGFRVARADPPRALVLVGGPRFARYGLAFLLDALDEGRATCMRARTHAAFPGLAEPEGSAGAEG